MIICKDLIAFGGNIEKDRFYILSKIFSSDNIENVEKRFTLDEKEIKEVIEARRIKRLSVYYEYTKLKVFFKDDYMFINKRVITK